MKRIPIWSKGKVCDYALCSTKDYSALLKYTWFKSNSNSKDYYPRTNINGKSVTMHQYVKRTLCASPELKGYVIDHINHNRIDCRRSNLRFVTITQNCQNRKKHCNAKSKFKGVYPKRDKYCAKIVHNKNTVSLGVFDTDTEAAEAFDRYVAHHQNILAPMNNEEKRIEYANEPLALPKGGTSNYMGVVKINGRFISRIVFEGKRFIKNETDCDIYIDHIDGNPLNNTQENLRVSDKQKNAENQRKRENASSKYLGVFQHKDKKRWMCKVFHKGKILTRQLEENEEYAARRRDLFILRNLSNTHFKLNFNWTEETKMHWSMKLKLPTINTEDKAKP